MHLIWAKLIFKWMLFRSKSLNYSRNDSIHRTNPIKIFFFLTAYAMNPPPPCVWAAELFSLQRCPWVWANSPPRQWCQMLSGRNLSLVHERTVHSSVLVLRLESKMYKTGLKNKKREFKWNETLIVQQYFFKRILKTWNFLPLQTKTVTRLLKSNKIPLTFLLKIKC